MSLRDIFPLPFFIASDHAGFHLKSHICSYLTEQDVPFHDLGTTSDESVDYPYYGKLVCDALLGTQNAAGILICGTGIGMSMTANRFSHIRAAVCNDGPVAASLSRAHNNANILCLGERLITPMVAMATLRVFLTTPFEGGRHQRRIDLIS